MSKTFESLAKLIQTMVKEAVKDEIRLMRQENAMKVGEISSLGYLTAPEACRKLGIDRTTLWRWIKNKQIPADQVKKLGKMTWIHQDFMKKMAG